MSNLYFHNAAKRGGTGAMIFQERPIIFNPQMVRSIINGDKTQTRRIVKPQPVLGEHWRKGWIVDSEVVDIPLSLNPFGIEADRLYVRERFGYVWPDHVDDGRIYDAENYEFGRPITDEECNVVYYADDPDFVWFDEDTEDQTTTRYWKPSIHMPKARARLWLEIEKVRLERLQKISIPDVRDEGIRSYFSAHALAEFRLLWNRLNGDRAGGSWNDDPWVWVIEFKVAEIKA